MKFEVCICHKGAKTLSFTTNSFVKLGVLVPWWQKANGQAGLKNEFRKDPNKNF
jgi:hypothetical protein